MLEEIRKLIAVCQQHHADDLKANAYANEGRGVVSLSQSQAERWKLIDACLALISAQPGGEGVTREAVIEECAQRMEWFLMVAEDGAGDEDLVNKDTVDAVKHCIAIVRALKSVPASPDSARAEQVTKEVDAVMEAKIEAAVRWGASGTLGLSMKPAEFEHHVDELVRTIPRWTEEELAAAASEAADLSARISGRREHPAQGEQVPTEREGK